MRILLRPICWIKTLNRTLTRYFIHKDGIILSGHDFKEISNTDTKQILECMICGVKSVGYKKQ